MTNESRVTGAPDESGNTGSPGTPGPARPWTDDEMATAEPLPLPTVDDAAAPVGVAGVPHVGTGDTKPGGRPEHGPEHG